MKGKQRVCICVWRQESCYVAQAGPGLAVLLLRGNRRVPTHPPEHSLKQIIYCDFNTTVNVLFLFSVFSRLGGLSNLKK